MSRRRKRSGGIVTTPTPSSHKVVNVTVAVPLRMSQKLKNSLLVAPPISQIKKRSRHTRVPFAPWEKTKVISVRVAVPRSNRPRAARMMVNSRGLTIFGEKNVKRMVPGESHRRRRDESKRWKRRASTGYLDSTRRDSGLLRANQNRSAEMLADSALVNAAYIYGGAVT